MQVEEDATLTLSLSNQCISITNNTHQITEIMKS